LHSKRPINQIEAELKPVKLFQKIENLPNANSFKRIQLAYEAGLAERALSISLQQGQLTDFDNVFCLDIVRTAAGQMFHSGESGIESFLFKPNTWQELLESISEVVEFNSAKQASITANSKTTLILNDLAGLIYLFNSHRGQGYANSGINTLGEFFLQLKFVSDQVNLILLSGNDFASDPIPSSFFTSKNRIDFASSVSPHLLLKLINPSKLIVSFSALPEWSKGESIELSNKLNEKLDNKVVSKPTSPNPSEAIQSSDQKPESDENSQMQIPEFLPEFQITESQINALQSIGSGLKTNILKKVKETSFNAQNEISSDDLLIDSENIENTNDEESISVYESLLSKLAEAKGKVELLEVRKEIQSLSSTLSAQQKVALNEIYKIHLQRIKLIEGSFSETPA
jgi:hypothetical protein